MNYLKIGIAVGIFAAGFAVNGWRLDAKIERLKADHAEQEAQASALYASSVAELRKREQENTQRINDAEAKRLAEQKRNTAIADDLRRQRDGLRVQISDYAQASGATSDSVAACRDRASALGNLLQEALRSSEEGAIDGERCEGNVRSLLESWPK